MAEIRIASGYVPGSLGRVAELHGSYYHRHGGFGQSRPLDQLFADMTVEDRDTGPSDCANSY